MRNIITVEEPKGELELELEGTHKGDTEEHNGVTRLHQTGIEDFLLATPGGWTLDKFKAKYDNKNVVSNRPLLCFTSGDV